MGLAYLNGDYLPLEECKISALDRGFIFGDAIYELIPVYQQKPFRLNEHLQRLQRSLAQVKINNPMDNAAWETLITKLITSSGFDDLYVYIQVTRGVAPRDHAYPRDVQPTVFAMTGAWPPLHDVMLNQGLTAISVDDLRWNRCDIKVTSLLANVMKKQEAIESDAHEAIFIRDGYVLEGSATNVFVVKQGEVMTAPKNNLILPGISRDVVVELMDKNNIPYLEVAASEQQLRDADEIWITSSTKECLPVTTLDDKPVGDGKPGKLWQRVYSLFQDHKHG